MKIHSFFVLLYSGYGLCNTIVNVRLVDHTSYAINFITRTMNIVEENGWCNLKLPDYVFQINESILAQPFRGTLRYTNGFVIAIQHVDIVQTTVQQVWNFNAAAASTHTVTVRATMRLHDVAVGYDVVGHWQGDDEDYRYTVVYVQPLVKFAFSIIKDVNTDNITVTVVGSIPAGTSRAAEFRPKDSTSDIFVQTTYDILVDDPHWASVVDYGTLPLTEWRPVSQQWEYYRLITFNAAAVTAEGLVAWGPQVFQPITLDLVTREIPFPVICYNCPIQ